MATDPVASLRCWGNVLLIFGILGGIGSFTGPLWAFIVGCMLVCCLAPGDGMRQQMGSVKCICIVGIIFCTIAIIGYIAVGAWFLGAHGIFCDVVQNSLSQSCSGRHLEAIKSLARYETKAIAHPKLLEFKTVEEGRALQSCGCPSSWVSDGMCDAICNNAACNFDAGDCSPSGGAQACSDPQCMCDRTDSIMTVACLRNNDQCDDVCNTLACGYDGADCGVCHVRTAVETHCDWVEGVGVAILVAPTLLHIIYIVGFSFVLKRSGELLSKPPTQMSGVVMQQPVTVVAMGQPMSAA
jgi:hypothetical protein